MDGVEAYGGWKPEWKSSAKKGNSRDGRARSATNLNFAYPADTT